MMVLVFGWLFVGLIEGVLFGWVIGRDSSWNLVLSSCRFWWLVCFGSVLGLMRWSS